MTALGMLQDSNPSQPCIGRFVNSHDVLRIPEVIPQIMCPAGTGNRCIQIELPMNVSYIREPASSRSTRERIAFKIIYVPTGCYDSKDIKKKPAATSKLQSTHKKSIRRHHEQTMTSFNDDISLGDQIYTK